MLSSEARHRHSEVSSLVFQLAALWELLGCLCVYSMWGGVCARGVSTTLDRASPSESEKYPIAAVRRDVPTSVPVRTTRQSRDCQLYVVRCYGILDTVHCTVILYRYSVFAVTNIRYSIT